jgi:hypothetical protein
MPDIADLTSVLEDAVTFPILTKEVGSGGASRNGDGTAGSGASSLTRTAQGAIRDLLGWRYRTDDPKGFLAALNKAVELKEVDGHTEFKWTARPFMVQADLGEVTGAQASIYERARVAAEHALPLLDGLKPLRADADQESTESVRRLVRSALTELVAELGVVGGPRIQRVDGYFTQLLGISVFLSTDPDVQNAFTDPENVKGTLGQLRDRFGLKRGLILTVDEERNFTNFLIVVDYTTSILQTWVAQRQRLARNDSTAENFLGTELVRLSQLLSVIVESVHEAYDAMDSVFFGPEERAVTTIQFGDDPAITVGELLAWVEQFAGVEAPQLIEDSGKDGVDVVRITLERLRNLVLAAVSSSQRS